MATNVGKSTNTTLQKKKKLPILVKKNTSKFIVQKGLTAPCWKIDVLWIGGKPRQHI